MSQIASIGFFNEACGIRVTRTCASSCRGILRKGAAVGTAMMWVVGVGAGGVTLLCKQPDTLWAVTTPVQPRPSEPRRGASTRGD